MNATETLVEFIKVMHEWETQCAIRQDACDRGEISFKETVVIGEKLFCPIRDQFLDTHVETRDTDFHFSVPPSYDPGNEIVVSMNSTGPKDADVCTRQLEGFKGEFIYKLRQVSGVWKIREKYLVAHDEQLVPANL